MDLLVLCGRRPLPNGVRCHCNLVLAVAEIDPLPLAVSRIDTPSTSSHVLSIVLAA
jgi:hypothetical protein